MKKWYENKILKKLFLVTTDWNVAWKETKNKQYIKINNPTGYWLADPLVFEDGENTFLFVEAFEKATKKGKIAVMKYKEGTFKDFNIILDENYHLSYPFVFKYKDLYYMIPESSADNSINLFVSTEKEFPLKWNLTKKIATGKFVDTTLYRQNEDDYLFTTYNIENYEYIEGLLDMKQLKIDNLKKTKDIDYIMRPGGKFFEEKGQIYKPIQNNYYFYGQSLNIKNEKNEVVYELLPTELTVSDNEKYRRIHTFSKTNKVEVIDISNFKFDLFKILKKISSKK